MMVNMLPMGAALPVPIPDVNAKKTQPKNQGEAKDSTKAGNSEEKPKKKKKSKKVSDILSFSGM